MKPPKKIPPVLEHQKGSNSIYDFENDRTDFEIDQNGVPVKAVEAPDGDTRQRVPSDASGLPCLYYNNSTESSSNTPSYVTIDAGEKVEKENLTYDRYGRQWNGEEWTISDEQKIAIAEEKLKDDEEGRTSYTHTSAELDVRTPRDRKKAFTLFENVRYLMSKHGIERVGFLTLTFRENLTDFKEAQRRFNSLKTHILKRLFLNWVVVVEPQKRGAVHYHLIAVCPSDIRTGFDFDEVSKGLYSSASPALRGLWSELRSAMPRYGFGRSELMPIKSTLEGAARYVGKYISKGCKYRGDQFKGARMVRYSVGWRPVGCHFSWYEHGAPWRAFVGSVGDVLMVKDVSEMKDAFGPSWAFKLLRMKEQDPDISPIDAAFILLNSGSRQ